MDFLLAHSRRLRIRRIPSVPSSDSANSLAFIMSENVNMGEEFRFPVSQEDRKRLTSSWASITDLRSLGSDIFIQIFMYRPALKRMFALEAIPADDLPEAPGFVKHVTNFAKFIDKIVTSMDPSKQGDTSEIEALRMAVKLGIFHVKVSKTTKFDPAYWTLFNHAICDQIKVRLTKTSPKNGGGNVVDKIVKAWETLFVFVTGEMHNAYKKQLAIEAEQQHQQVVKKGRSANSRQSSLASKSSIRRRMSGGGTIERSMSVSNTSARRRMSAVGGAMERSMSVSNNKNDGRGRPPSGASSEISASAPLSKQSSMTSSTSMAPRKTSQQNPHSRQLIKQTSVTSLNASPNSPPAAPIPIN